MIAQPGVTQKKGAISGKKMPATTTKNEDGTERKDSQEEAQTRHYQLPGVQVGLPGSCLDLLIANTTSSRSRRTLTAQFPRLQCAS